MHGPRHRNALAVIVLVALIAAAAAVSLSTRAPVTAGEPLYLLVTAGSFTYQPILLEHEDVLTLSQGEDAVNVIHVTPDSVWMESATCDNQDCVSQGAVTAENRQSRVLGGMIVCLPHRVQLELFTEGELRELGLLPAQAQ